MNRNFRLNLLGNTASSLANIMYKFCTGLYILDITNSAMKMSVFMAYSMLLGLIVQPFLGVLVERKSKVKIMYRTDMIFAFSDIILGIFLFGNLSKEAIWMGLYLNTTINTLMNAMCEPASAALVPLIVEEDKLPKAYSFFSIANNFINVFGTIFASIIYSFIPYQWILIFNGCLIGISAIAERFISLDEMSVKTVSSINYIQELKQGIQYLLGKEQLVKITFCSVIVNIFLSGVFSITLPFLYNTVLGLPSFWLGTIQVLLSIGSMFSAFIISCNEIKRKGQAIFCGIVGYAIIFWILYIAYEMLGKSVISIIYMELIYVCMAFCIGFLSVGIQIPINIIYATSVDPDYMGRVMSIRKTFSTISAPFAMILFGILLDCFSVEIVLLIGAIGVTLSIFVMRRGKIHKYK